MTHKKATRKRKLVKCEAMRRQESEREREKKGRSFIKMAESEKLIIIMSVECFVAFTHHIPTKVLSCPFRRMNRSVCTLMLLLLVSFYALFI